MMVIILMVKEKEMENIFMKMVIIIQGNLKMVYFMEKEFIIIQMEIFYMMVIILMVKQKEMENIYENGNIYIGQFKNDLPNGKGTYYYFNGKIKYNGDQINGEFVGN